MGSQKERSNCNDVGRIAYGHQSVGARQHLKYEEKARRHTHDQKLLGRLLVDSPVVPCLSFVLITADMKRIDAHELKKTMRTIEGDFDQEIQV
jgi:hypothetical protein